MQAQLTKKIVVKQQDNDDDTIKKGPGRPRKMPKRTELGNVGIVDKPPVQGLYMQFMYGKPDIFKDLIDFFKTIGSKDIHIKFDASTIMMYGQDHYKKSHICAKINCNKINMYYLKQEFDIGVTISDIEMVTCQINKDYNSISISSVDTYERRYLRISMDTDIKIEESSDVELNSECTHLTDEIKNMIYDNDYKINFTFPCKYFKRTVANIKKISNLLTFKQDSKEHNMVLNYESDNHRVKFNNYVNDPNKISFNSRLVDDENLHVVVRSEYLKSISNSHIATDIKIFIDEEKPLRTYASIDDGVIEIYTLTEIYNGES